MRKMRENVIRKPHPFELGQGYTIFKISKIGFTTEQK